MEVCGSSSGSGTAGGLEARLSTCMPVSVSAGWTSVSSDDIDSLDSDDFDESSSKCKQTCLKELMLLVQ